MFCSHCGGRLRILSAIIPLDAIAKLKAIKLSKEHMERIQIDRLAKGPRKNNFTFCGRFSGLSIRCRPA
jgi:hypothetical protein